MLSLKEVHAVQAELGVQLSRVEEMLLADDFVGVSDSKESCCT